MGEVTGTSFAVWAPRAKAVRVIGDFNGWDGRGAPDADARELGRLGALRAGRRRRLGLQIRDPVAPTTSSAPRPTRWHGAPRSPTGSVVDDSQHVWADDDWMAKRRGDQPAHRPDERLRGAPGLVAAGSSYRDLAEHLVNYVKGPRLHARGVPPGHGAPLRAPSWGCQVTGYRHRPPAGDPDDFKYLVDVLHQNGIGVILDWVPGHFPRDAFAWPVRRPRSMSTPTP